MFQLQGHPGARLGHPPRPRGLWLCHLVAGDCAAGCCYEEPDDEVSVGVRDIVSYVGLLDFLRCEIYCCRCIHCCIFQLFNIMDIVSVKLPILYARKTLANSDYHMTIAGEKEVVQQATVGHDLTSHTKPRCRIHLVDPAYSWDECPMTNIADIVDTMLHSQVGHIQITPMEMYSQLLQRCNTN